MTTQPVIDATAKETTAAVQVRSYDPQMLCLDDNYLNPARFDQIYRIATAFSRSDLVPAHFRGKAENCFIAVQFALRAKIDPMVALQGLYIVQGKPGMESKLAIALLNTQGKIKDPLRYEEKGQGDDFEVTVHATTVAGTPISASVSMKMAKTAGWTRNQAYATMPSLMLRYRAAIFLIRTHFPEVLFGMQTKEELEDVAAAQMKNVTPLKETPAPSLPPAQEHATSSKSESLTAKLKRKATSDRQPGDETEQEVKAEGLPF